MKFDGIFKIKWFQLLINYVVLKIGLNFKWVVGINKLFGFILNTCIKINLELFSVGPKSVQSRMVL